MFYVFHVYFDHLLLSICMYICLNLRVSQSSEWPSPCSYYNSQHDSSVLQYYHTNFKRINIHLNYLTISHTINWNLYYSKRSYNIISLHTPSHRLIIGISFCTWHFTRWFKNFLQFPKAGRTSILIGCIQAKFIMNYDHVTRTLPTDIKTHTHRQTHKHGGAQSHRHVHTYSRLAASGKYPPSVIILLTCARNTAKQPPSGCAR